MNAPRHSCMGGWCQHRDHCAHYHTPFRGSPAERLCERGQESPVPIVWRQQQQPQPDARSLPEAA